MQLEKFPSACTCMYMYMYYLHRGYGMCMYNVQVHVHVHVLAKFPSIKFVHKPYTAFPLEVPVHVLVYRMQFYVSKLNNFNSDFMLDWIH